MCGNTAGQRQIAVCAPGCTGLTNEPPCPHTPKGTVHKIFEGRSGHLQGSDSSHVVAEPGNRAGGEGPVGVPDDYVATLAALPRHCQHTAAVA